MRLLTEDNLRVRLEVIRKGPAESSKGRMVGYDASVIPPIVVGVKDGVATFPGNVSRNVLKRSQIGGVEGSCQATGGGSDSLHKECNTEGVVSSAHEELRTPKYSQFHDYKETPINLDLEDIRRHWQSWARYNLCQEHREWCHFRTLRKTTISKVVSQPCAKLSIQYATNLIDTEVLELRTSGASRASRGGCTRGGRRRGWSATSSGDTLEVVY